jgi:glutamyl-tRNA synthetase
MNPVRVRFAPSPTGALHIGGVRTALYNYLLARKTGGTMILRIEDTDQGRFVSGAEEFIIESLAWAGIKIDEGVGVGGPHAPYRQSERKPIYKKYAQQLLDSGHAYYAFDTEEDLNVMRDRLKAAGSSSQQYDSSTRMSMKNSLTLDAGVVQQKLNAGDPYVIRVKLPAHEEVSLNDLIRGTVTVNSSLLDDKVLMKSDGMPTYHLANVVDDYEMKITHVIRGEEWLPSAPLHVLLYRFFGWENVRPQFAHLPLLLKPDGNGKLSKRDADKMGFPIFPLAWKDPSTGEQSIGYKEAGYLPDALINFLAFLGWNPGTEQEIFSMDQLVDAFSIERIGKAGAKFDIQKAQWFNQQYLKAKSNAELAVFLLTDLKTEGVACTQEKAEKVCLAMRERITFPKEIWQHGKFFFNAPTVYDEPTLTKKWNVEAASVLAAFSLKLSEKLSISADEAKTLLESVATSLNVGVGKIMQALRISLTGGAAGPDLMITIEIIGAKEAASRIQTFIQKFPFKA